MSAPYRVTVTIGPTSRGQTWSWTVNRGDPVTAFPVLLDGMSFEWAFPDSPLWPVQPDPVAVKFSILAEDAADLNGIDRDVPVLIRVWAGFTMEGEEFDAITFPGRISDVTGSPLPFGHPVTGDDVDGWRLDVIAVDRVADLGQYSFAYQWGTPPVPHPVVAPSTPLHEIIREFAAAGLPAPDFGHTATYVGEFYPPFRDGGGFPVVDNNAMIQGTNLLASTVELLTQYADGGYVPQGQQGTKTAFTRYPAEGWRHGIVQANTTDDGGINPAVPYRIEWVSRRYGLQPGIGPSGPGQFGNTGSGYGIILAPPPDSVVIGGVTIPIGDASVVISADYVDHGAQWTRNKFDDPNVVTVLATLNPYPGNPGLDWKMVTETNQQPGEGVTSAQVSPKYGIIGSDYARWVAEMYLGDDAEPSTLWAASGFRWYASQDPSWPIGRSLFPGAATWGGYSSPIVVDGIPATQRPNGRRWYVGVPKAVTWTFGEGEFVIDLDLFPRIPRPVLDVGIPLTWAELDADFPTVTWAQLDDSDWLEYRLARSTVYS
ncbi:hypothetical protein ACJ5H2_05905 [Nocardioides sp. R1-1]|uniref:hypothetical protein n=1 Tax=Nocardioides sp. R1-1 TaxID=3383502 RepID=UPI0038D034DA